MEPERIIQNVLYQWNVELTGREKFAVMDALLMARECLAALEAEGLKLVEA